MAGTAGVGEVPADRLADWVTQMEGVLGGEGEVLGLAEGNANAGARLALQWGITDREIDFLLERIPQGSRGDEQRVNELNFWLDKIKNKSLDLEKRVSAIVDLNNLLADPLIVLNPNQGSNSKTVKTLSVDFCRMVLLSLRHAEPVLNEIIYSPDEEEVLKTFADPVRLRIVSWAFKCREGINFNGRRSDGARLTNKLGEIGNPINPRDQLLFAIKLYYYNHEKEGYFALAESPRSIPRIQGVFPGEKMGDLRVIFSEREQVTTVRNYRFLIQRREDSKNFKEGWLILSRKEPGLADVKYEWARQNQVVGEASGGFLTNTPKVLRFHLDGFVDHEFFNQWLIEEARKAQKFNALLVLEGGKGAQIPSILNLAGKLYPDKNLIYLNTQTLPETHKDTKPVNIMAVGPNETPALKTQGELYLFLQKGAPNLSAVMPLATLEAEIGFKGMSTGNPLFSRFVDGYQAQSGTIDDFPEFIGLITQGRLTSRTFRWVIASIEINRIFQACKLGARMAAQSA